MNGKTMLKKKWFWIRAQFFARTLHTREPLCPLRNKFICDYEARKYKKKIKRAMRALMSFFLIACHESKSFVSQSMLVLSKSMCWDIESHKISRLVARGEASTFFLLLLHPHKAINFFSLCNVFRNKINPHLQFSSSEF